MADFFKLLFLFIGLIIIRPCLGGDDTLYFDLEYSYKTLSPLGLPQQVIVVNDSFPGPLIEISTNNHVVIDVKNKLDEDLLVNWNGIQLRTNPWQDGVLGTNCPIPPNRNFTYEFQAKDQIGSFFYHPSINFQRASGGSGPFIVNNKIDIPLPFPKPEADIIIFISDWYNRDHKALRADLDAGKELGIPDGVLINGKGPYQYNKTLVPDGIVYESIDVQPEKTYRIRVHHVGISTSLNFRIKDHTLYLVETEGNYNWKDGYSSFDIHVGQSYSFLVTMDQKANRDYYIVASARFHNEPQWDRVTGVAILHYKYSTEKASGNLPDAPYDLYYKDWSLNQARTIRQNVSASGARPNPQGSFPYGRIMINHTYLLETLPLKKIRGKNLSAALNGISFVNPTTPIPLADWKHVKGEYKLDFPDKPLKGDPRLDTSIINGTYQAFAEIIFQNNDTVLQTFHIDGFSFYVVGMDYGEWNEDKRNNYNRYDAVYRCTVQVFPQGWTAVLIYLDNPGTWNIRTENLDRWYLGQETYIKIVHTEGKVTQSSAPDNVRYCGLLADLRKDDPEDDKKGASSSINENMKLLVMLLISLFVVLADLR